MANQKFTSTDSTQFAENSKMGRIFGLAITVCAIALVIGYIGGVEVASNVLAILKTITSGAFVTFAIMMIIKSKNKQNFAFSALLAGFSILWFVAELLWTYYNMIIHIQSSITIADPIWLAGYGVLFVYLMSIVWPIRKIISKKILFSSMALSVSYLIPSFIEISNNSSIANYEAIVNLLYPIADAVLLVPLIICFSLFNKTGKYLLWPLLIGLLVNIATDTLFLFAVIGDSYYFGNPLELGFVAGYIILACGAYRKYKFITLYSIPLVTYLKSLSIVRQDSMVVFSSMSLIVTTATVVVSLSLVQIYQYGNLSTREIMIFQPIIYGSIVTVLALCAVIVVLGKKFTTLKAELTKMQASKTLTQYEKITEPLPEISAHLALVQKRLTSMEKAGKKTTYGVLMICGIAAAVLLFYMFFNVNTGTVDLTAGRFVIEDLNGKKIDTWIVWNSIDSDPLHISIINSNLLSSEKIDAIKSGILSEETIVISDSELGRSVSGGENMYYKGWKGALQMLDMGTTSIHIPKNFEIEESVAPTGEIWIILSKDHSIDGDQSGTRSIADGDNHQILKSVITIYDIESLDNEELAAITRHEFGHALGLYSSETDDHFLYHALNSRIAYISNCNVIDLVSLYNENQPSLTACH